MEGRNLVKGILRRFILYVPPTFLRLSIIDDLYVIGELVERLFSGRFGFLGEELDANVFFFW